MESAIPGDRLSYVENAVREELPCEVRAANHAHEMASVLPSFPHVQSIPSGCASPIDYQPRQKYDLGLILFAREFPDVLRESSPAPFPFAHESRPGTPVSGACHVQHAEGVTRAEVKMTRGRFHLYLQTMNIVIPSFIQICFNFDLMFNTFENFAFRLLVKMFHCLLTTRRQPWQLEIQGIRLRSSTWPHLRPLHEEEAENMAKLMTGRTLALQLRSRSPCVAKLVTHVIDLNVSRIVVRQPSVGMRLLTLATE